LAFTSRRKKEILGLKGSQQKMEKEKSYSKLISRSLSAKKLQLKKIFS